MRIENLIRNYGRLLESERKQCPPATHDAILEHYSYLVANYADLVDGERMRLIKLAQIMGRWFAFLGEYGHDRDIEQDDQYNALKVALVGRYKWLKAHHESAGPDMQVEYKILNMAYGARWEQLNSYRALMARESEEYRELGALLGRESTLTRITASNIFYGDTDQIEIIR